MLAADARDILRQEATQLNTADGANLIRNYAEWAPDFALVLSTPIDGPAPMSQSIFGDDTGLDSASSLDKAQSNRASLHQSMDGLTQEMQNLGTNLGQDLAESILGSIFDSAVKQSLSTHGAQGRRAATKSGDGHPNLKQTLDSIMASAPGMAHSHESQSKEGPSQTQIQETMKDLQDLGSMLDDATKSGQKLHAKMQQKKQEKDVEADGKADGKAAEDLGRELAEKVLGSIFKVDHGKDQPSSGSQAKSSSVHDAMKNYDLGEALGNDMAKQIFGSILKMPAKHSLGDRGKAAMDHSSRSSVKHFLEDQFAQADQKYSSGDDKFNDALGSILKEATRGGSKEGSEKHYVKLRGSQKQAQPVTSETHVEHGKSVTKETSCDNGHCKTVVTTEDLD